MMDINLIKKMATEYQRRTGCTYEKAVIKAWSYLGGKRMTLQEIGDVFGITRQRADQNEQSAKRKLKAPNSYKLMRKYLEL